MGRWFVRIVGAGTVRKMQDSAEALRTEYKAGRQDGVDEPEGLDEPAREVPHRVVENAPLEPSPNNDSE
jgi:hypothetical protein